MLPRHRGIVLLGAILTALAAAVPASAKQSRNATLLAHQNLHSRYSGSWPYIHTDGREYVAVGSETADCRR